MGIPNFEEELLDKVYEEMMGFSALDTMTINNILDLAEIDDNTYELACKWLKSQNTLERRHFECLMGEELKRYNSI